MPAVPYRIFEWLVDFTAASTLVLGLGYALALALRAPAWRQRVLEWSLVGCLLVAIGAMLPGMPRVSLGLLTPEPPATRVAAPRAGIDFPVSDSPAPFSAPAVPIAAPSPTQTTAPQPVSENHPLTVPAWLWMPVTWLYLMGLTLSLGYVLLGHAMLYRLSRKATPPAEGSAIAVLWRELTAGLRRSPQLLLSDHAALPMTFGLFRPVIMLPRALTSTANQALLPAILRHELTHIRRHDARTWSLVSCVQMLAFYQPLLWVLRPTLRRCQEQIADASAADAAGSVLEYAEQLLALARTRLTSKVQPFPAMGAVGAAEELAWRLRTLVAANGPVAERCSRLFSIGMGVVFLALASAGVLLRLHSQAVPADAAVAPEVASPLLLGERAERHGVAYLLSTQEPGGAWLPQAGPAVTALAVKSLLQGGYAADAPAVRRGLAYLASTRQPDHGYYTNSNPLYNTAIVLSTLALLPDAESCEAVTRGKAFLQAMRSPTPKANAWYQTPAAGETTESSDGTIASLATSAVASVNPAGLDRVLRPMISFDPQERSPDATLPTYGSMTYAGLKSMLYAEPTPDDARVQAALRWIQTHYTLDLNPGTGGADGQFYYYHTLAKTLRTRGGDSLVDAQGHTHAWRSDLRTRLASLQQSDGSWVNHASDHWLESNPVLVTTYGVLTLQELRR